VPEEKNMRAGFSAYRGIDPHTLSRIFVIATAGFLISSQPAHADPLLLETGLATGSIWPVLIAGLAIESLILSLIIKRPFSEVLTVCLLANAITGFTGFIVLLLLRLNDIPVIPLGPGMVAAWLIEAGAISLMLSKPPIKRIYIGSFAANAASAVIALFILGNLVIPSPDPEVSEDLELARNFNTVRKAIETYHDEKGYFPKALMGGIRSLDETGSTDPLLESGILETYPANPYAPNLRSRRFNMVFLLSGLGTPTQQVSLDQPSNEWEVRWFPILRNDPRFGNPDQALLCANGLSDSTVRETLSPTFYHMNGADCVPGCFFYKSYDFNLDGEADDYIFGAYGWPTAFGTVPFDIIDAATGEISLSLSSDGTISSGSPDGVPEPVMVLHVAGT